MAEGFPTPFEQYRTTVPQAWIDGQGHMNVGCYGLVFDAASFVVLTALGFGPAYGAATGHGTFVVESHTLHSGELLLGDAVEARTRVLGADRKRLHLAHELIRTTDHGRVAAQEVVYLHVDLDTRRVVPFLPQAQAAVRAAVQAHAGLPALDWTGRTIPALPPEPV